MKTLAATDVAIVRALANKTLTVTKHVNARLNNRYFAINDENGLIVIALSASEVLRILRVGHEYPDELEAVFDTLAPTLNLDAIEV